MPNARLLREAMGRFATGVTIVITRTRDGSPAGCTVNAFCSLSLEPPLALVCIGKKAATTPAAPRFPT